jgi:hypothetical protein
MRSQMLVVGNDAGLDAFASSYAEEGPAAMIAV